MSKMTKKKILSKLLVGLILAATTGFAVAAAEGVAKPSDLMRKLDILKGTWVGDAKGIGPDGKPYQVRQTERVGSMLNGDVLVIEGRGYKPDGLLAFNAFGTVAADPKSGAYEFHAYAQGRAVIGPVQARNIIQRRKGSRDGAAIGDISLKREALGHRQFSSCKIDKDVGHRHGSRIGENFKAKIGDTVAEAFQRHIFKHSISPTAIGGRRCTLGGGNQRINRLVRCAAIPGLDRLEDVLGVH